MRIRGFCQTTFLVCLAVVLAAACGGSQAVSSSATTPTTIAPQVSLTRLLDQIKLVHSYEFATTSVEQLPAPIDRTVTISTSGMSDVSTNRSAYTTSQAGSPDFSQWVIDGSRQYHEQRRRDSEGEGSHWCSDSSVKRSPGPGIFLVDTVAALARSNRGLQRVGAETLRGIPTTHYQVTGPGSSVDIWVDSSDRLRRLGWVPGHQFQRQTTDFFDFDQPTTITVPTSAPPCTQ
jgi:hypothetical protein